MEEIDKDDLFWNTSMLGCFGYLIGIMTGVIFCALMFGSCTTTRYVPVPEVHTDTVRVNHTAHDSIYVRDSIYVNQWQSGDTVYVEKVKWNTVWENHTAHDTVYKSRTDSIPVPYEVVKEVPAELNWWQRFRLHLADILMCTLGMLAVIWIIKRK